MATFPPSFELSSLNGGHSGRSVSGAGDVNGDGVDDVIIGAAQASPEGRFRAGESYVVFGSKAGFAPALELANLDGSKGFRIAGIRGDFTTGSDYSGFSVSAAGDFNNDGVDDLIIGAIAAGPGGRELAGESYVVFGSETGFTPVLELANLDGTNGFRIEGIDSGDFSGQSVSGAGAQAREPRRHERVPHRGDR